jgi:hypothetical protein
MNSMPLVFGLFVFLSAFNAGAMTTLQIQHYGIYSHVGPDGFAAYIRANNRAAVIPVILPAMLLLLVSLSLLLKTPRFMTFSEALAALLLNVVQLASTFIWQRRLQAEMATTGYDEAKVSLLVSTNWIRTVAFLLQALLATAIVLRAIS